MKTRTLRRLLAGLCVTACLMQGATVAVAQESDGAPPARQPHHFDELAKSTLDVSAVLDAKTRRDRTAAVYDILNDVIDSGDRRMAVHAIAFGMMMDEDKLSESTKRRLNRVEDDPEDLELRLAAMELLAIVDNQAFSDELSEMIDDHRGRVRMAAMRIARHNKANEPLCVKIESRLARETDPAICAEGHTAIAALSKDDVARENNKKQLLAMAVSEDSRIRFNAVRQLGHIRSNIPEYTKDDEDEKTEPYAAVVRGMSKRGALDEKAVFSALMTRDHALREHALKLIAEQGSASLQRRVLGMASSDHWHGRAIAAYYAFETGNKRQALRALSEEKHPVVQLALLATLIKQK